MWFLNQRTGLRQDTTAPLPSSEDCDGVLVSLALCLLMVLIAAAGSPVPDTIDRNRREEAERIIAEEMQRPANRAAKSDLAAVSAFSSENAAAFVAGFGGSK